MTLHPSHPVNSLPPLFFSGEGGESGEGATKALTLQGFCFPTISESVPKQWGSSPLFGVKMAFLPVFDAQRVWPRQRPPVHRREVAGHGLTTSITRDSRSSFLKRGTSVATAAAASSPARGCRSWPCYINHQGQQVKFSEAGTSVATAAGMRRPFINNPALCPHLPAMKPIIPAQQEG